MANIQPTEEHPCPGTYIYTWGSVATPMANTDVPLAAIVPGSHNDKTVQVYGTPGALLVVDVQGTDETIAVPTGWQSLREPGNALLNSLLVTAQITAKTAMRQILESAHKLLPVLSGGDGTTAIIIKIKCTTQARR